MLGVKRIFLVSKIIIALLFIILAILGLIKINRTSYAYETSIRDYVYLGGQSIKINMVASGLIATKDSDVLETGDYIYAINNNILGNTNINEYINDIATDNVLVTFKRNNNILSETVSVATLKEIMGRNSISGNATLTYINPDNLQYAAVGHSILTNTTLSNDFLGTVNQNKITGIIPSTINSVGRFISKAGLAFGKITTANEYGIYGSVSATNNMQLVPVGNKQDIHLGNAKIVTTIDDVVKSYDIVITKLNLDKNETQISFDITDPELINNTNGIIKGMSGSPILQDGLLVGAVSHAINNDFDSGYGLLIEYMLEYTK